MKKSKNTENLLPVKVSDNVNDAKIAQAIAIIDKKLAALGGSNSYIYKVGNIYNPFNVGQTINIQGTELNMLFSLMNYFENLLDFMVQSKKHYNTTLANLWYGVGIESILLDIDNKVKTLINATAIAELNASKQALSSFKSSEQRLFDTLLTVDKLLKS